MNLYGIFSVIAVANLITGTVAQGDSDSDSSRVCRYAYHTSGIIDDRLYIVGGLAVYETHVTANTLLRSLDLTKPFSLNSKTPLPFAESDIPSQVPESTQASLWADVNKKQLVLFPGNAVDGLGIRGFNAPKISEYWVYDIVRKTWSSFVAQGVSLGATMATAWVDKLQRGFMVGGVLKSDEVVLPGNLVTFDAEKNNWANETTNNVAERFQAQLVYVEGVGSEGILVVLGGLGKGYNTQSYSFDTIDVYDIGNKKWYRQVTTSPIGVIPEVRGNFCAVVNSAPDGSSHNIAIFGGGLPTKAYNTVHILSLPSFQWFLANDEQHSTNSKAPGERDAVTCHQVSSTKRYLMTIGGRKFGEILDNFCDVPGAYLFDLSSLSWTDQYDPKGKPYEVPLPIQRNVGGNSKGGATLTAPRTGFNDPGLEALFSKNPKTDNATPGTTTNSGTDQTEKQNTESSSGSSSKVPIGPVVGAACGIVAIVCILIGAFLWHRKKKRRITASDDVINSAAYQQHPNNRKGLFGRKLDETEEHRLAAYGFSNKHELPQEGSRDVVPLRPELGSGEQMGAWTANQGRMQPATPEHWGHERYQENPSIPVEMWAGAPTPRLAPAELDSMGSNRTQTQTHGTRP